MDDVQQSRATWPTLGQTLDYLRALGFVIRPNGSGHLFAQHHSDDSWFAFFDRDLNTPTRTADLVDMKWQLPGRGFVTDEEFARFWNPGMQPAPQPDPVPTS